VHLGAEVGLHGGVVDEVLGTVDTVELGESRLVEVHVLIDELPAAGAQVIVDLVEITTAIPHTPPPLQVGIAIVHLLALRYHSHLAGFCLIYYFKSKNKRLFWHVFWLPVGYQLKWVCQRFSPT